MQLSITCFCVNLPFVLSLFHQLLFGSASFGGIMEVDTRTYKVTREIKIGQRRRVIAMALVPTHFIGSTVWVVCGAECMCTSNKKSNFTRYLCTLWMAYRLRSLPGHLQYLALFMFIRGSSREMMLVFSVFGVNIHFSFSQNLQDQIRKLWSTLWIRRCVSPLEP